MLYLYWESKKRREINYKLRNRYGERMRSNLNYLNTLVNCRHKREDELILEYRRHKALEYFEDGIREAQTKYHIGKATRYFDVEPNIPDHPNPNPPWQPQERFNGFCSVYAMQTSYANVYAREKMSIVRR